MSGKKRSLIGEIRPSTTITSPQNPHDFDLAVTRSISPFQVDHQGTTIPVSPVQVDQEDLRDPYAKRIRTERRTFDETMEVLKSLLTQEFQTKEIILRTFTKESMDEMIKAVESLWSFYPTDSIQEGEKILSIKLNMDDLERLIRWNLNLEPTLISHRNPYDPSLVMIDPSLITGESAERGFNFSRRIVVELERRILYLRSVNKIDDQDWDGAYTRLKWVKDCMMHGSRLLFHTLSLRKRLSNPMDTFDDCMEDMRMDMASGNYWNNDKLRDVAKLRIFFLGIMNENRFRKRGDDIYEPFYYKNKFTFFWKRKCSIDEFVMNQNNWIAHPHGRMVEMVMLQMERPLEKVCSFMKAYECPYFPTLKVSRYLFSFRDVGVWDIEKCIFYPHEAPSHDPERETTEVLCCTTSCQNWYDLAFDDMSDVYDMDIETPAIDGILEMQRFDAKKKEVFHMASGRLLFPVKYKDRWEFAVGFFGFGGTGKSSLIRLFRRVFPPEKIGWIGNRIERQWALSSLFDKDILIAYEVKGDFQWDQTEFQSIVSGEEVLVFTKHKTAFVALINAQILLSGNEFITGWKNMGDQLRRRFLVFFFDHFVPKDKINLNLQQDIDKEFSRWLQKVSRVYKRWCHTFGNQDIWTPGILPKSVIDDNDTVLQDSNSLERFYQNTPSLVSDKTKSMEFELFHRMYREYSSQHGFQKHRIIDLDSIPAKAFFNQHGFEVVMEGKKKFVKGLEYVASVAVQPATVSLSSNSTTK